MSNFDVLQPDRIPVDEYTPEKADHIVNAFSEGKPISEIVAERPEWLPRRLIVRRWRTIYPAFDLAMTDAEHCRGEYHLEKMITVSKDDKRQAASVRNEMQAHEKAASVFNPAAYGTGARGAVAAVLDTAKKIALMGDDELLAIAAGGVVVPALEHDPHPPLSRDNVPIEYEVSGPQTPKSKSQDVSVTTKRSVEILYDAVEEMPFTDPMNPDSFDVDIPLPSVHNDAEKKIKNPDDVSGGIVTFVGME